VNLNRLSTNAMSAVATAKVEPTTLTAVRAPAAPAVERGWYCGVINRRPKKDSIMSDALHGFLIGKVAVPDHPATVLNPNGRSGFVITEVRREDGRLFVRGNDTMWFGEGCITRFMVPQRGPTE